MSKPARNRKGPRKWYQPRRSRRPQRWALGIVVVAVGIAGWAGHGAYRTFVGYPERAGVGSDAIVEVDIPSGATFDHTLDLLVEHAVIGDDEKAIFKFFALDKGATSRVAAGKHRLRGDMTPTEILDELMRRPKAPSIRVTIPEGKHSLQIAEILAEAGLGEVDEFVSLMRDPALLKKWGIEADSVEGFLFPDTYRFTKGAEPRAVVGRLLERHQQVWDDLRKRHFRAAASLGREFDWHQREIVTLASIVEKETGNVKERPHIARVFLNRLRFDSFNPKRLETDPTIIYGCTVPVEKSEACTKFEGRIRRIHLRDKDNPYNTYTHEGLPPGPISNPGRAAIEAVLDPRRSRALFFVARNDGTHHFSDSRAEHERAVDKYIRGGAVGDGVAQ